MATTREVLCDLKELLDELKLDRESRVVGWILSGMLPNRLGHLLEDGPRSCDWCGRMMCDRTPRARYCSEACRQANHRGNHGNHRGAHGTKEKGCDCRCGRCTG